MINFIVCEDDDRDREITKEIITKYMMKNEMEYKVHQYNDYDKNFIKMVNTKISFKIYILDIEMPSASGIDMARIIRNKDVDSVIIFLTGHDDLSSIVAKRDFSSLTFINKFDKREQRLKEAFDEAFKFLKVKRIIRFKDGGTIYTIALEDILYITKDSVERKCVIKTDYSEFRVSKSLTELSALLSKDFVQTHRSCIVNTQRVVCYNKSKRLITFDNGEIIDIVSTRFEGKLI